MVHWAAPRSGETGPDRHQGLYVHLIAPDDVSRLDSEALVLDIMEASATGEAAKVEAKGSRLVLLRRRAAGEPFQFVRALGTPSRALIEKMADEQFPEGCNLTIAWLVDSPIMFVVAWDIERSEALPLGGLGRAAWVPLHEHLSRLVKTEATGSPPGSRSTAPGA